MEQKYKYMVCTSCMTYNHAPYIVDAMNGFAIQETTFPVYYLITDDASTDGEPEVIKQYLADHFQTPYRQEETDDYYLICTIHKTNPNCIFIVFLLKYNHYSIKKSKLPYQAEWRDNAKYLAICEGDDYWVNPVKICIQVDYMEKNINCGMTIGGCRALSQLSNTIIYTTGKKTHTSFRDILIHTGIGTATCTVMYKMRAVDGFSQIRDEKWLMSDYPLFLFISLRWDIYTFEDTMAVYRVLSESASHSASYDKRRIFLNSIEDIQLFFCERYAPELRGVIQKKMFRRKFLLAIKFNQKSDVNKYLLKLSPTDIKCYLYYIRYKLLCLK